MKIRQLEQEYIQELKENQLADLAAYVQQIETMYDEIRSFRHDYHNVLISLNESIQSEDVSTIKKTYSQVLEKEGLNLQKTPYSLAKLNNLRTLPIKGVFSTHIITAWQKKINVYVEIEEIIANEAIDILDYVRIISILLDNAIEAAEKALEPLLRIVIYTVAEQKKIHIIIENSCEDEQVNIVDIFRNGYSTKGENRGIGLANVNKILKEYPYIFLQTECEPFLLRQTLILQVKDGQAESNR